MSAYVKTEGHSPLVQILNGHEVWRCCTPKQREILRGLLVEINDRKTSPRERFAVRNKIDGVPARTLASLCSKGVCDESGIITLLGAYGALWGPELEKQEAERRARRAAS